MLRLLEHFIPKVVSVFHLTNQWVLPSFQSGTDPRLQELDVPKMVNVYLQLTASFRLSKKLFIPSAVKSRGNEGHRQGIVLLDSKHHPEIVQSDRVRAPGSVESLFH